MGEDDVGREGAMISGPDVASATGWIDAGCDDIELWDGRSVHRCLQMLISQNVQLCQNKSTMMTIAFYGTLHNTVILQH